MQITEYTKTILIYYRFFCILNEGIQFFFHDTCHFLFVLLIV